MGAGGGGRKRRWGQSGHCVTRACRQGVGRRRFVRRSDWGPAKAAIRRRKYSAGACL